mmetsp:Transcript_13034/g.27696  ORF Transcript_13034/g.27696 Transcript_13034/m.27696 type:complete len:98 (+) Transcript_13034:49-342(+)
MRSKRILHYKEVLVEMQFYQVLHCDDLDRWHSTVVKVWYLNLIGCYCYCRYALPMYTLFYYRGTDDKLFTTKGRKDSRKMQKDIKTKEKCRKSTGQG